MVRSSSIMETFYIKTPLGTVRMTGDENGISEISALDAGNVSSEIPIILQESVTQLQEYFQNKIIDFTFKCNPKGTDLNKKLGKNY